MNSLSKVRRFNFNKNDNYTCRDFTYTYFADIDFPGDILISFFRSDFRGSRFENVIFRNNCFDRADFISCTFVNCKFINTNIGASEIKSCYFYNVSFEECKYDNTSIQESTFEKCSFNREHILVNMKNCHLLNSSIYDCTFERSTTEAITFEFCQLCNTDLATMHAECHKFISCELKNVKLGLSYVFGYLLCDTSIKDFEVLYRGKAVTLNSQEEAMKFLEESRMYEIINIFFLYQNFEKIPKLLEKSLLYLYNNFTPSTKIEIINIFEALIFYTTHDFITYQCFIECLAVINEIQPPKLRLEDELQFVGYKEKLNYIIPNGLYGKKFIESSYGKNAFIILHIETEDYNQALNISNKFLEELYQRCMLMPFWELTESQKGSWVLTFAISALIIVVLPKVIKNYYAIISEIQVKKGFKRLLLQKLEKKRLSIEEINQLADVVTKLDITQQIDIDIPQQISSIKALL